MLANNVIKTTEQVLETIDSLVFIDLKEELARHGAKLLLGNGYYVKSKNKKIHNFLNKILDSNDFENMLYSIVYLLSKNGRVIMTIDKTEAGNYVFQFAKLNYFAYIGRGTVEPQAAVIYKELKLDNTNIIVKEEWDTEKVVRSIDTATELNVDTLNTKLPKDQQIKKVWYHNLGLLPLVEFVNKPLTPQLLWNSSRSQNFEELADDWPVKELPALVNNSLRSLFKEILTNKTRIIGNFSPTAIQKLQDKNLSIKALIDEFILAVKPVGKDGNTPPIEILSPEGSIFSSINETIEKNRELYYSGAGYSLQNDAQQDTATQTLYAKSKDVETTKFKRNLLIAKINDFLDRLLKAEGLIKEIDAQQREYSFTIRENLNVSELETTQLIEQQLNNGLISRLEAIAKIRGFDDPEDARDILEAIKEEEAEQREEQAAQAQAFQTIADTQMEETEETIQGTPKPNV